MHKEDGWWQQEQGGERESELLHLSWLCVVKLACAVSPYWRCLSSSQPEWKNPEKPADRKKVARNFAPACPSIEERSCHSQWPDWWQTSRVLPQLPRCKATGSSPISTWARLDACSGPSTRLFAPVPWDGCTSQTHLQVNSVADPLNRSAIWYNVHCLLFLLLLLLHWQQQMQELEESKSEQWQ